MTVTTSMKKITALFTQLSSIANMAESFPSTTANMFSLAAKQTPAEADGERKRKRDDDSQAKLDTKPPALRQAFDKESQPDPVEVVLEVTNTGGSGSFAAAVAANNDTDWTKDELKLLKDKVDALGPCRLHFDEFAVVAKDFQGRNAYDVFWKLCSLSNTGLNWTQDEEGKLKELFERELQKNAGTRIYFSVIARNFHGRNAVNCFMKWASLLSLLFEENQRDLGVPSFKLQCYLGEFKLGTTGVIDIDVTKASLLGHTFSGQKRAIPDQQLPNENDDTGKRPPLQEAASHPSWGDLSTQQDCRQLSPGFKMAPANTKGDQLGRRPFAVHPLALTKPDQAKMTASPSSAMPLAQQNDDSKVASTATLVELKDVQVETSPLSSHVTDSRQNEAAGSKSPAVQLAPQSNQLSLKTAPAPTNTNGDQVEGPPSALILTSDEVTDTGGSGSFAAAVAANNGTDWTEDEIILTSDEVTDTGGSGSFAAAVAANNGTDWTEDEMKLLKDKVDALGPCRLRDSRQNEATGSKSPAVQLAQQSNQPPLKTAPAPTNTNGDQVEGRPSALSLTSDEVTDTGGSGSFAAAVAANNDTEWTEDELKLLKDKVDALGPCRLHFDEFAVVANDFQGRNAFDVFWKLLSQSNTGLNWTHDEEGKLKELFERELQKNAGTRIYFSVIARNFPGRNAVNCFMKWASLLSLSFEENQRDLGVPSFKLQRYLGEFKLGTTGVIDIDVTKAPLLGHTLSGQKRAIPDQQLPHENDDTGKRPRLQEAASHPSWADLSTQQDCRQLSPGFKTAPANTKGDQLGRRPFAVHPLALSKPDQAKMTASPSSSIPLAQQNEDPKVASTATLVELKEVQVEKSPLSSHVTDSRQNEATGSKSPAVQLAQQSNQPPLKTAPAPTNTNGDQVEGRPSALSLTSDDSTALDSRNATSQMDDESPPTKENERDNLPDGQPPIDVSQSIEQESHAVVMPWTGVRGWMLLLASLVLFAVLRAVFVGNRQMASSGTLKPVLPPCFLPSSSETIEDEGAVLGWCDDSKERNLCPQGGICSGGELRSCVNSYRRVAENGDQCILSAASNKTLANAEAILAERTAHHYCALTGSVWGTKVDVSAPTFDLSLVVENVNVVTPLLQSSQSFTFRSSDNKVTAIGLTEEYIRAHSVVPCLCRFRISVITSLEDMEVPMLHAVFYIWFILKLHPLVCVLISALLVVLPICVYQRWQAKRDKSRALQMLLD